MSDAAGGVSAEEALSGLRKGAPAAAEPALLRAAVDPDAITQTGPGVPDWRWRTVPLSWNGPVVEDQEIRLMLVPPGLGLALNILRVLLLAVLAARIAGMRGRFDGLGLILLVPFAVGFAPGAKADFPPPALLEQLSQRLLEPPDCVPNCAGIARLRIDVTPEDMTQTLDLHALQRVSLGLPGQEGQWLPQTVTVDGAAAGALSRDAVGGIRLAVEPGRHRVVLSGRLPPVDELQLPLPSPPQAVEVNAVGWAVEGVGEDGVPGTQLKLVRQGARSGDLPKGWAPRALEPFLHVERTLRIGLDWRVETTVTRISPADQTISLDVPLLSGESVITEGLVTRDGSVTVNLAAGSESVAWSSRLEPRSELTLTAPETKRWVESWRADVSPVWHMTATGIPVAHHQDAGGNWLPEWVPWPGDTVALSFVRPIGSPGNTLTIDDSRLELRPGLRASDGSLALTVRSAQGTQHRVLLPEGASLLSATVNGQSEPIRQDGRSVNLPVYPGRQSVSLQWRLDQGMGSVLRTPAVDLGAPSVNHRIDVQPGPGRWILLVGGPELGPAVLYWGMLAVIALLAPVLARVGSTPLGTRSWLLLLLGLSQIPIGAGLVVVVWLLALGWRAGMEPGISDRRFNALQVGLAVLTLCALALLLQAVEQGLLGYPDMQIAGNGSDATALHWYQDRSPAVPPQAWIVSVPLWAYRAAMLAWALWLALALLDWLRWGWDCYSRHGLWRRRTAPDTDPANDGKAPGRREVGAESPVPPP